MKDWTEQLLTAAATLGVVAVFVLCVHRPRQRAVQDLGMQAHSLEQKISETQQQCSVLMPLTQQVEHLRVSAGLFERRLPRDGQVGPFLQQVGEQLRDAHLSSLEMRPGSPVDGARFSELPIRMGFSGKFGDMFSFLEQLERLTRAKRIVELNLVGETGSADGVRADLLLSIYCAKG